MAFRKTSFSFLLCIVFLFSIKKDIAQSASRKKHDSLLAEMKSDTIVPFLVNKVKSYTLTIDRDNSFVRRKINLSNVTKALPDIEKRLKTFKDRLAKSGRPWNLRGLNSAVILLKETSEKLTSYQSNLDNYSKQLTQNNNDVKIIINDPILEAHVPDSVLQSQLSDVSNEVFQLDTLQQRTISQVNLMRNRVSVALLQANDVISDMTYQTIALKTAMWQEEEPPLFAANAADYRRPLGAIMLEALQRSVKIISIYVNDKWDVVSLCLLLFIFITAWCLSNMRRIKRTENANDILQQVIFFKRSVLIGCLMGLFTYAPFLFANPTMSFLHVMEFLRIATLSFLLFPYLTKQSKLIWFLLCALWIYYALDDVLLESAFGERWLLFVADLVLIAVCIKLISTKNPYFVVMEESSASKALIIFTLAQVVLSVVFDLTGRTSLAKIFGISAIQCLMLGLALKVFCTMVLEAIFIQSEAYQESRFSEFINYKELQHRFKKVLWVLAIAVWLVSLIRNLALYDLFTTLMGIFFSQERNIGSMTFTFQSVAVFFVIIWISTVISKFINFFFAHDAAKSTGKRSSLGSMLLLIRLAVWALGFFIAIAAAGIPLDKLSIMIGALSVGIGFGLQNIVNNLVSGVIIAFEQPIQVGDQIEIGNKAGTVKEIGVRSSTIKSGDGADIIIPNGDLLSQHLINWTMQNRNKRVEFIIGVPYNSNVPMVKTLIQEVLEKNENILHAPAPVIIVQAFAEKSIDVRIMFWVPDLSTAGSLRSAAMIEIFEALMAAGVDLPAPPKS